MSDEVEKLLLDNGLEGAKYLTNYDYETAIIGATSDNRIVYDYDLMIEYLINKEGFDYESAADWISYNTERALPYFGSDAPIILYRFIDT